MNLILGSRYRWVALVVGVTIGVFGMASAASAQGDGISSYEFDLRATTAPAGDEFQVTGYCRSGGTSTSVEARALFFHRTPQAPVEFSVPISLDPATGNFVGGIPVPPSVVAGDYLLSVGCNLGDQAWGYTNVRIPVTITPGQGGPATTTTTVPSTSTTTTLVPPTSTSTTVPTVKDQGTDRTQHRSLAFTG